MSSPKKFQKIIYSIIISAAVIWCGGFLLSPMWAGEPGIRGSISDFLYAFYSSSCHQIEDRSFAIWGSKLGVCSRCTLIYFGFLVSSAVYPFLRKLNNLNMPPVWLLFAGAGLVALDAGLDIFDVVKNTFITREATGAVIGLILPFYIIPGCIRVFDEFFAPPKIIPKK